MEITILSGKFTMHGPFSVANCYLTGGYSPENVPLLLAGICVYTNRLFDALCGLRMFKVRVLYGASTVPQNHHHLYGPDVRQVHVCSGILMFFGMGFAIDCNGATASQSQWCCHS